MSRAWVALAIAGLFLLAFSMPVQAGIFSGYSWNQAEKKATITDWFGLVQVMDVQLLKTSNHIAGSDEIFEAEFRIVSHANIKATPKGYRFEKILFKGKPIEGIKLYAEKIQTEKKEYLEETCTEIEAYEKLPYDPVNKTQPPPRPYTKLECTHKKRSAEIETASWIPFDLFNYSFKPGEDIKIKAVAKRPIVLAHQVSDVLPVIEGIRLTEFVLWDSDWKYREDNVNSTGLGTQTNVVYLVNGTSGTIIDGEKQFIWGLAESVNTTNRLFYKNYTTYELTNSSNVTLPSEVESGNGTSINSTDLFGNDEIVHLRFGSNTTGGSNLAYDSTKYGTNGTIGSDSTWTDDGLVAGGLRGFGNLGSSGNGLNFTFESWMDATDFTMIAWIKPVTSPGGTGVGSQRTHVMALDDDNAEDEIILELSKGSTGDISFLIDNSGSYTYCTSGGGIVQYDGDVYQQVAVSYDQDTKNMSLFYNGSLIKSCSYSGNTPIGINSGGLKIFKSLNDDYYQFNGTGDEFAAFNRTLSVDEINTMYQAVTSMSSLGEEMSEDYAPVITIDSPHNETTAVQNQSLTINATDIDDEDKRWYTKNGGESVFFTGNTTLLLDEGANNISVFINDTAGNEGSSSVTVTLDTTAPSVTILDPSNATYSISNLSLNVTADEVVDVWTRELDESNATFMPNSTISASDGTHVLIIYANDSVGNVGSAKLTFTADTTDPVIAIDQPQNKTYSASNISLDINYTEERPDKFWYVMNGGSPVFFIPNATILGAEGLNNLTIHMNDTGGNAAVASMNFSVDTTDPVIAIDKPQNKTYSLANRSLDINYTEENPDSFWYVMNGGSPVFFMPNTTILGTEGFNNLTVHMNDSAGNSARLDLNFTADTTDPVIAIDHPHNKTYLTTNISLDINYTESNLDKTWYVLNGGSPVFFMPNATIAGSEGLNNLTVHMNDSAGNAAEPQSVNFTVDATTPPLVLDSPQNTSYNYQNITLNSTSAADDTDLAWYSLDEGADTYFIFNTTISAAEGSHTLRVWVNDTSGNENVTEVNFTVDLEPPEASFVAPTPGNDTILSDVNYLNANVSSNENISSANLEIFNLDTGGYITVSNQTYILNSSSSLYYGYEDNYVIGPGLNENTTAGQTSGDLFIYKNEVGGSNEERRVYLKINNSQVAGLNVSSAVLNLYLNKVYSSENVTANHVYHPDAGGRAWDENNITWYTQPCGPKKGNLNETAYCNVTNLTITEVNNTDTGSYVSVDITDAVRNDVNSGFDSTSVVLRLYSFVNENDTAVMGVVFSDRNTTGQTWIVNVSTTSETANNTMNANGDYAEANITNLQDARYRYKAWVEDQAGNINHTEERIIEIDTNAPVVSINQPSNTTYTSSNVTFNITATTGDYDVSCYMTIDGSAETNIGTIETGQTINSSVSESDGFHNLSFRCQKTSGNRENGTAQVNFTIDTTAPDISFVAPTPGNDSVIEGEYLNVNITSDETISNASLEIVSGLGSPTNYSMNISGDYAESNISLSDGTYEYKVWANDTHGNMKHTEIRTVELDSESPSLAINSPDNITYNLASNITIDLTLTSDRTAACYYSIDGGGETSFGTHSSGSITSSLAASRGFHNLSFRCQKTSGNRQNATGYVNFTTTDFNLTGVTYDSTQLETNLTSFTVTFNVSDNIDSVSGTFEYNGSQVAATASNSGQAWTLNMTTHVPLIQTNNTAVNWTLNYTYSYDNGTALNDVTAERNQTLSFAYAVLRPYSDRAAYIEGETAEITSMISKKVSYAVFTVNTMLNNSAYAASQQANTSAEENYSASITVPVISDNTTQFAFNSTVLVEFNGNSRLMQSSNGFLNVSLAQVMTCGDVTNTTTLNITSYDEDSPSTIVPNTTIDVTFYIWTGDTEETKNYSYKLNGSHTYQLCIYPPNQTIIANASMQYYNESGTERNYYLVNANFTNVTKYVNLYILDKEDDIETKISLNDENEDAVSDAIGKIQKYYFDENRYRTIAMTKSDGQGEALTRLKPSTSFYQFIFERDASVIGTFGSIQIDPVNPDRTFTISLGTSGYYYDYVKNIASLCYNTTSNIVCTSTSLDGTVNTYEFRVRMYENLSWHEVHSQRQSSAATIFNYTVGSTSNQSYYYELILEFTDSSAILQAGYVNFVEEQIFQDHGIFAAFLIIITLAFVGLYSPQASLIFAGIGVLITSAMGLFTLSIGSVVGLLLVIGIFIWRMSDR